MEDRHGEKILVHICCAACFSYVEKILRSEKWQVVGFFYNPNVHGRSEYGKRLQDVKKFCQEKEIELITVAYNVQDFFSQIMPYQDEKSIKFIRDKKRWKVKRCQICLKTILLKGYEEAKSKQIPYFTTTMLTTPYKDHEEIEDICSRMVDKESEVRFYYRDFRKGYWNGRNFAKNHNMYIPSYCGCVYSAEEGILE